MNARNHPRHHLDPILIHPVRLSITAALAEVERAEFAVIRDSVQITDSALSKQIALLETAGFVEVTKGRAGRYSQTRLALTRSGLDVYHRHVAALRTIAGDAVAAAPPHADALRRPRQKRFAPPLAIPDNLA